jgi:hypothetical protein
MKKRENFLANHKMVVESNLKNLEEKKSLRLSINKTSDLSFSEFSQQ